MTGKRIRKILAAGTVMITLCLVFAGTVSAGPQKLQSYCDEDQWFAYIPDVKDAYPARVQVSNEAFFSTQTLALTDLQGAGIHTVFLFDNSFSISEQNREVMKETAARIVNAHTEEETYSLATFDDSMHILAQESSDYEYLLQLIQNIGYANQPTFLKDALYAAYLRFGTGGKKYIRFVVFTDGCDDNRLGYGYDELRELYEDSNFPVYTVGSVYEAETSGLEQLFSFSRSTGAAFYLLDEMTDISEVPERLQKDAPAVLVEGTLPRKVQDGGMKDIRITVEGYEEDWDFHIRSRMPFADMQKMEEDAAAAQEQEEARMLLLVTEKLEQETELNQQKTQISEEAQSPAETQNPEDEPGPDEYPGTQTTTNEPQTFFEQDSLISGVKNMYTCLAAAAAAGILGAVLMKRRKREKQPDEEEVPEDLFTAEEEPEYREQDDATMILKKYPGPRVVRWSDSQKI